MATIDAVPDHDAHHGDDHHHPAFLAHHFDTPEQQFDAGKLGIWLFLVTEVLFFGGLFCAYALYRSLRPDVFAGSSEFLNTQLGAINTGVLLFSSLTMAWAVRCAQLRQHKLLTVMLATTLSCAAIFLGVKAVEYSHKWHLGLLPVRWYSYNPDAPHHAGGPNYLLWLSVPFMLIFAGLVVWLAISKLKGDAFKVKVAFPLTIAAACYFVGVGLGMVLESGESAAAPPTAAEAADEHHAASEHAAGAAEFRGGGAEHPVGTSAQPGGTADQPVDATEPPDAGGVTGTTAAAAPGPVVADPAAVDAVVPPAAGPTLARMAQDPINTGARDEQRALLRQQSIASGTVVDSPDEVVGPVTRQSGEINTPKQAGVFFGIYYCMTGVHAIHILGGMGVLAWLLVRSVREDFHELYFGPVDYVGLYWHLVDLIWIYLFPLLYLIG